MENRKELTPEELEQIEGGLIVDRGFFRDYWVVDDRTGEILATYFLKPDAKWQADVSGVSKEIISEDEYHKRFNR